MKRVRWLTTPRLLPSRNQHRAFVRVARLFPDALTPWIGPTHRVLKRFERLYLVMDSMAFEVEGEAVVARLRVEGDLADGN